MKKVVAIVLTAASLSIADQSSDELRKEFDNYKKDTEARISSLENQLTAPADGNKEATASAALTAAEIKEIKDKIEDGALNFSFYGYFRSGLGVDDQGETMSAFKAPNSEAKYRLGNEAETYAETGFANKHKLENLDSNASFNSYIMLAYVTPNDNNNNFDATTSLREAYAEAVGVAGWNPTATFWAGQRYYSRYDVHMNDFYYRDMSGFGGGVSQVALPDGKTMFELAWIGGSMDKLDSNGTAFEDDTGRFNKNSLDFGLTSIPLPGGTLDALVTVSSFEGDSVSNFSGSVEMDDNIGAAVMLAYKTVIGETGKNMLVGQFGQGSAYNFKSQMMLPSAVDASTVENVDIDDLQTIRILDNISLNLSDKWSLQALALYQNSDLGTDENNNLTWISFGIRPSYHFNRFFSIETELGYDYTDKEDSDSGDLWKFTIAPQITPSSDVLSRPSLRVFLTYATWSDDFEGQVGIPSYSDDNSGISAGVQVESWF